MAAMLAINQKQVREIGLAVGIEHNLPAIRRHGRVEILVASGMLGVGRSADRAGKQNGRYEFQHSRLLLTSCARAPQP